MIRLDVHLKLSCKHLAAACTLLLLLCAGRGYRKCIRQQSTALLITELRSAAGILFLEEDESLV
jgi:hypothetical protein